MVFLKNLFIQQDENENVEFAPIVDRIYKVIKDPEFYVPRTILKTPLDDSNKILYWPIISTGGYMREIIENIFHA
jgi:hypothetical protein